MQNLIYDQAPYDILYYDSNLDVYRNDKFAGWQNMPADGTPLFTSGDSVLNYTLLTDATAQPSPTPEAPAAVGLRGRIDGARRGDRGAQREPRPRTRPRAAAARTRPCSWPSS